MNLYGVIFTYNEPQKAQMQVMAENEEEAVNKAMMNIPSPPPGLEIVRVVSLGSINLTEEGKTAMGTKVGDTPALEQAPKQARKAKEAPKKVAKGPATPLVVKPSQKLPQPEKPSVDRWMPEAVIERGVEQVKVIVGDGDKHGN